MPWPTSLLGPVLMYKAVCASLILELVKSLEETFCPPQHLPEGVSALTKVAGSSSAITGLCLLCLNASSCVLSQGSASKEKPKPASEHFIAEKMKKAYYLTQKIPDQV